MRNVPQESGALLVLFREVEASQPYRRKYDTRGRL